jgi:hypothetical protein
MWLRTRQLLIKIKIQFPHDNLSLLLPIDAKLDVWLACIKRQLKVASQVFVIKGKVTVTKNRYSVSIT